MVVRRHAREAQDRRQAHPGTADGLTRAQAEKELRKRIERDVIVPTAARRTIGARPAAPTSIIWST